MKIKGVHVYLPDETFAVTKDPADYLAHHIKAACTNLTTQGCDPRELDISTRRGQDSLRRPCLIIDMSMPIHNPLL